MNRILGGDPTPVALAKGGNAGRDAGAASVQDLQGEPPFGGSPAEFRQRVLAPLENLADYAIHVPRPDMTHPDRDATAKDGGWELDLPTMKLQWLPETPRIEEDGSHVPPVLGPALRESAERCRTLLESSPEPLAVNWGAKIIDIHPAAAGLTWVASAPDPIGKSVAGAMQLPFDQSVLARLNDLVDRGVGAPLAGAKSLNADGTASVEDAHGTATVRRGAAARRAAMHDVTGREQVEAARASLEAQLRESQKMEAIGTLASGIAHDFNNIITSILGNAELARRDASASPLALESLEEIRKAATRARELVRQILSFGRHQPSERKRTALGPVVEETVCLLRATLPSHVTLNVHCDKDVPSVLANATQIQQILLNFATNAMQAMQGTPGRIGIRLDTVMLDAAWVHAHPALQPLREKHSGCTVRLAVSDTGPGMDATMLERIFEPFFTTKAAGEGTGLGLAVVKGIVQAHEGAVVVDSQPGKGATFTCYLPAAEALAGAPAREGNESDPATVPIPSLDGGPHIIYLDDDESLVFLVQRLLERHGCRVSAYTDQHEALAALRADPAGYALVVTDYNMPGMSGLDVAREARAIRADLPVAVASGYIDDALRARADGAGVRELVFKADALEDLCETLAGLAWSVGNETKGG